MIIGTMKLEGFFDDLQFMKFRLLWGEKQLCTLKR